MLKVTQLVGFGGGGGGFGFKSASSYNGSFSTSHSITMPSFSASDLLFAMVYKTDATTTSMSGWTELLDTFPYAVYYKIAVGGDTAPLTLSSARAVEASIAAYGPTSGVEGTPTVDTNNGDITLSAITVTTSGGILIAAAQTTNTVSTPSGFTLDSLVTPSSYNTYFFSKRITSTGSTGTVLLDESSTATQGGALIYIKP